MAFVEQPCLGIVKKAFVDMSRSVKVLHVLDHSLPVTDGYSMRSHNIIRYQQRGGLSAVGLTSGKHGGHQIDREIVEGVTYYRDSSASDGMLRAVPLVADTLLMQALYVRITQVVRQESCDLIHVHSPVLNGLPALFVGRKLSLPVVYEMRALWEEGKIPSGQYRVMGIKPRVARGLETWLLRRVQAVTTICEGLKEEIVSRGVSAEKVRVFLNGVDTVRYCARPTNRSLKKSLGLEGCFVLGFIGSFYEWEGLDVLVRSLLELKVLLPHVRVLLVGGGEAEAGLKTLVESLGLASYVVFAGKVPNAAVSDYYSVIDVCVYPRPKNRLTDRVTPLKPLEAMAAEKVVLASDVGGHKELINDGRDGFLFSAGDHRDLAAKVQELNSRFDKLSAIGQQARQRVQGERNWESITSGYHALYSKLLVNS